MADIGTVCLTSELLPRQESGDRITSGLLLTPTRTLVINLILELANLRICVYTVKIGKQKLTALIASLTFC